MGARVRGKNRRVGGNDNDNERKRVMESEQSKLTEEGVDGALYGNIMDTWGFLKQAHQGLWEDYIIRGGAKSDALTKRQRRTKYGQEQGARWRPKDSVGNLRSGLGRLNEIAFERWGMELE